MSRREPRSGGRCKIKSRLLPADWWCLAPTSASVTVLKTMSGRAPVDFEQTGKT